MSLVKWAFIGLLVLPAAEIVAFVVVAALIGWLRTAALFIATSVVGVLLLRRSGRADLDALPRRLRPDRASRAVHLETPGFATMLGGILLIFPGFITDSWAPRCSCRSFAGGRRGKLATLRPRPGASRPTRRSASSTSKPDEWHQIPDQRTRLAGASPRAS